MPALLRPSPILSPEEAVGCVVIFLKDAPSNNVLGHQVIMSGNNLILSLFSRIQSNTNPSK